MDDNNLYTYINCHHHIYYTLLHINHSANDLFNNNVVYKLYILNVRFVIDYFLYNSNNQGRILGLVFFRKFLMVNINFQTLQAYMYQFLQMDIDTLNNEYVIQLYDQYNQHSLASDNLNIFQQYLLKNQDSIQNNIQYKRDQDFISLQIYI